MTPVAGIGLRHPHYAALMQRLPALGFVEVHSENFFGQGGAALAVLDQVAHHYPVSLHGVGLSLGSAAGLDEWHLDQLADLVLRVEPVRVSDHASFARAVRGGGIQHAADLLPVPFTHEALNVMCSNVQRVQDRLQRPLLVENLSAYLQWSDAEMSEPRFLRELARRTGCSLLLDVNNIYVNALNAQIAGKCPDPLSHCRHWMDELGDVAVGEIHVAGHLRMDDIVIDDHGSRVADEVWDLLQHALRHWGAVPTLVEWDTDIPPLDVLLQEQARAQHWIEQQVTA